MGWGVAVLRGPGSGGQAVELRHQHIPRPSACRVLAHGWHVVGTSSVAAIRRSHVRLAQPCAVLRARCIADCRSRLFVGMCLHPAIRLILITLAYT